MNANVFVYGKLRFCVRGFSEGKSDVTKQATTFDLAQHQQFFIYGVVVRFLFFGQQFHNICSIFFVFFIQFYCSVF
jgi:hypothetical protein